MLTLTVKCFIVRSCFCPNILILKREKESYMKICRFTEDMQILQCCSEKSLCEIGNL